MVMAGTSGAAQNPNTSSQTISDISNHKKSDSNKSVGTGPNCTEEIEEPEHQTSQQPQSNEV